VTLLWENLPPLLCERANCASFVTTDEKYLYAFGGFNFPATGQQQKAIDSIERVNLHDVK
jgi:hypothetical protein